MPSLKKVTLTQNELDAFIAKQVAQQVAQQVESLQTQKRISETTVSFEKFNGFDTVRIKGPFGKGGFTLGLNKAAAMYQNPVAGQIIAHLKAKGKRIDVKVD